jgi:alpha-tubulin suppressor-like RCC1 family protein
LGLGRFVTTKLTPEILLLDYEPIKAKFVSCGENHSIIIDMNDNILSFGNNVQRQLGLNDKIDKHIPTKISTIKAKFVNCGAYHTMIIDLNNDVWGFGCNYCGQLGLYDKLNNSGPKKLPNIKAKSISCSKDNTIILDLNNNLWAVGRNYQKITNLNTRAKSVNCNFIIQ